GGGRSSTFRGDSGPMGGASLQAEPAGLGTDARFQVDAVEVREDELVVTGRWHDVRGLRFVRPTLLAGDSEVLASVEHKPWDPGTEPSVATFPWEGDPPDLDETRLNVAPRITVSLAGVAPKVARKRVTKTPPRSQRKPAERKRDTSAQLRAERDRLVAERDELG